MTSGKASATSGSRKRTLRRARRLGLVGAAAAAFFVGAQPAAAVIVDVTYTGVVNNVVNPDGLFGSPQLGDTFVVHLLFDTSDVTTTTVSATGVEVWGGTWFGGSPFVLSATATIGGVTTVVAANIGHMVAVNDGATSRNWYQGEDDESDYSAQIYRGFDTYGVVNATNASLPGVLNRSFSYDPTASDAAALVLSYYYWNPATNEYHDDYIDGAMSNVTVVATPEASTWAMMAVGFACLGMAGLSGFRTARKGIA